MIRKRAVLALYKVFMKYPDALEYGMDRLKERLEDPDIGVWLLVAVAFEQVNLTQGGQVW